MKIFTLIFCMVFFLSLASSAQEQATWAKKFDVKDIQNSLVKISDSLYACTFEVANEEYRFFMRDLKANNRTEDYKVAAVDTTGWKRNFKYAHLDPMTQMYNWHLSYSGYPVVNISYEAAVLFCNWLTEKYNSTNGRRFNKVKFRLPAAGEWEYAARGGLEKKNYPFGNYLRGEEGKFMCNFRPVGDERITTVEDTSSDKFEVRYLEKALSYSSDNVTYTAPVKSFFPNGYGLYNMSGNVAEMVQEKGIARGGSWQNTGYDVRIVSEMHFENSSPLVGFRYFMEVIERY